MATTSIQLEESLLNIWNDRNADSRRETMKKIYAPGIHFFESNDAAPIVGREAINELISKLQAEWPLEFRFTLN